MRKLRQDRNHVIYLITADTGDTYIGLTVALGQAFLKSVKVRVQKHFSAAKCIQKDTLFACFIRDIDTEYTYEIIEIIRGRKPAHSRERELIAFHAPSLNQK